jgi:hypothetical protein
VAGRSSQKVLLNILTFVSKCTRALTLENLCGRYMTEREFDNRYGSKDASAGTDVNLQADNVRDLAHEHGLATVFRRSV